MTTLQDKLDNIYQTKLEIKSAIGTDSDVFSEYPAMIRSMAGGGVSYSYLDERLSYYVETEDLNTTLSYYVETSDLHDMSYVSHNELESMGYITIEDVPQVDLSSYVTYTYLESKEYLTEIPSTYATYAAISEMGYITYSYGDSIYVSYAYIGDLNEITEYILGSSSSEAPENVYATKYELGSYVSKDELNNASYATESYVSYAINNIPAVDLSSYVTYTYLDSCGYITSNDLPVIDESIIPKQNNTYNLGSSTKKYKSLYLISGIEFSDWSFITHYGNNIHFVAGNDVRTNNDFLPIPWTGSKNINLGNANYKWAYTYTYNLILGNENINNIFPTYAYVTELINNIPGVGDLSSYATKAQVNAMFSYDTTTGTLTITTIS